LLLHCISNTVGAVGLLSSEHADIKREKSVTLPLAHYECDTSSDILGRA